jgi:hypothetical protein
MMRRGDEARARPVNNNNNNNNNNNKKPLAWNQTGEAEEEDGISK